MLRLEQRLQQRYPSWFRGRRAKVARPVLRTIGRLSRFAEIDGFLAAHGHLRDFPFVSAALDHLQVRYEIDGGNRIPATGGLLVVANHPSGALDALALLDAIGRVRRDVRIVANDMLSLLEPIGGLLLPVRIFGGRPGRTRLHAIRQALAEGQCVVVFPAGEVSRLGLRGIRDTRWRRGFLHFARSSGAPVLPIRVEARNSSLFYGVSALYKPAATALLAREMYARRQRPLRLRVGELLRLEANDDAGDAVRRVRTALYAIGRRPRTRARRPAPIARAVAPQRLREAIAATELLGETADGKQIRLARCAAGGRPRRDALLLDIGRLRGLYTASLFRYADDAVPRLAEGMELGRSFVAPEYWGGRSLDYLWQGIGAYLRRYPRVRYLFGAVSISGALDRGVREQLVAYYQRYYGSDDALATSNRPFAYFAAPPTFDALDAATAFGVLKGNLAAQGAAVPTLYKQYTELCEPGGARFLAFGVDPAFSDAIDGLIEVDLQRVRPHKRRRYLLQ